MSNFLNQVKSIIFISFNGKNNIFNLIQEVVYLDLYIEFNFFSDLVLKVIEYFKIKLNKFQIDFIKGSEWKKVGLIFEYSVKKFGKFEFFLLFWREVFQ